MKSYRIWSEGYAATGQSSGAISHGIVEAASFKEACDIKFEGDSLYSPDRMTYWGCQLFDNESDARKSFG